MKRKLALVLLVVSSLFAGIAFAKIQQDFPQCGGFDPSYKLEGGACCEPFGDKGVTANYLSGESRRGCRFLYAPGCGISSAGKNKLACLKQCGAQCTKGTQEKDCESKLCKDDCTCEKQKVVSPITPVGPQQGSSCKRDKDCVPPMKCISRKCKNIGQPEPSTGTSSPVVSSSVPTTPEPLEGQQCKLATDCGSSMRCVNWKCTRIGSSLTGGAIVSKVPAPKRPADCPLAVGQRCKSNADLPNPPCKAACCNGVVRSGEAWRSRPGCNK